MRTVMVAVVMLVVGIAVGMLGYRWFVTVEPAPAPAADCPPCPKCPPRIVEPAPTTVPVQPVAESVPRLEPQADKATRMTPSPPSPTRPNLVAKPEPRRGPAPIQEGPEPPPAVAPAPEPESEPEPEPAAEPHDVLSQGDVPLEPMVWDGTREGVQEAIRASAPKLRECYVGWASMQPGLGGRMSLTVNVSPLAENAEFSGVSGITVKESEFDQPFFTGCVVGALQDLRFSTVNGEGLDFTIPLVFRTNDE